VAGAWEHGRHALLLEKGYLDPSTLIAPADSAEKYQFHNRGTLRQWTEAKTFGRWKKFYSYNQVGMYHSQLGMIMPEMIR
jgi:hypothetical protein